jgi:hypothetical protein
VSLVSVVISVLGNRTQERLLAASVWPNLSFDTGNTTDDRQQHVITISVANSGNGPARIRTFALDYEGTHFFNASALLERCCELKTDIITSPVVGKVLRPGEQVRVLEVPYAPAIADGWRKLDRARFGFALSACYCSTLGECWNVRSDGADPEPVDACPATPRKEQWQG